MDDNGTTRRKMGEKVTLDEISSRDEIKSVLQNIICKNEYGMQEIG